LRLVEKKLEFLEVFGGAVFGEGRREGGRGREKKADEQGMKKN
jgi:hypothetical protein